MALLLWSHRHRKAMVDSQQYEMGPFRLQRVPNVHPAPLWIPKMSPSKVVCCQLVNILCTSIPSVSFRLSVCQTKRCPFYQFFLKLQVFYF